MNAQASLSRSRAWTAALVGLLAGCGTVDRSLDVRARGQARDTEPASLARPVLVEAEAFDDLGGWTLDSQFMDQMGSPYLLAHGLGRPVARARTTIVLPEAGSYRVWVRHKDWVPSGHPGRFRVHVDGEPLEPVFGTDGEDWHWQDAGRIALEAGEVRLELEDLTGFDGRCDAILLAMGDEPPPAGPPEVAARWRRALLGLPDEPPESGPFDVVVVGGGVPGSAAALTAARLGCRVALVQNRPVLGGNGSSEVGIKPRGWSTPLTSELVQRDDSGDLSAERVLRANENVSLFLNWHVFDATREGDRIVSVVARHRTTNRELRFTAPIFIDCSGRAAVGRLVGAETRSGRESRAEFGESLAPEQGDAMHHGNTILFHTRMADHPVPFPEIPWAVELAGDYADLGGQTPVAGEVDEDGPRIGPETDESNWTHFWEYGQWLDGYRDFETIRDHLLRALYGTFSNVKTKGGEAFANLELSWVSPVLATGEWDRLVGDHVLTENDVRQRTPFEDAVAINSGKICLHYPGAVHDFRLAEWKYIRVEPFTVPLRCLYSRNIANLLMAGKHISVTHVAGGVTKFMLNGAQCAVATGAAAYLCRKHDTTPRGIYEHHLAELKDIVIGRGDYVDALEAPASASAPR